MRHHSVILFGLLLYACSLSQSQAAENCDADGAVQFVCGVMNPEDLLAIPDTPWVIASGRISTTDGYLYAVDTRDHSHTIIFPNNRAAPAQNSTLYGSCPGPTASTFQPHGIALRTGTNNQHVLYVVGHGEREAVEVFSLDAGGELPRLTWIGCVIAPEGVSLNSVTPLPGSGAPIAVTNFNVAGGEVWEWQSGSGWSQVPGSEMSGPNGIVSSDDGRWLYIGSWGDEALVRLSRGADPVQRDTVGVGFHVDNVRWSPEGGLLAAGQYSAERAAIGPCLTRGLCEGVASRAALVDPDALGVQQLVDYGSNDLLVFGTVAIAIGNELWVSGIAGGTRIARFPRP